MLYRRPFIEEIAEVRSGESNADPQRPYQEPITMVKALISPSVPHIAQVRQHWTFTQRPFYRNPTSDDEGSALVLRLPLTSELNEVYPRISFFAENFAIKRGAPEVT